MSGVFGYLSASSHTLAWPVVEQMGARMQHQPHFVVETDAPAPQAALGRIGIGIFNQAPQPVRSADGQVWLWLCGEFYHQEQRRAALVSAGVLGLAADDADLALQVYLREGVAGLTRLEGAFVLVVWDGRSAELVLVNDRYGLYPHYYAHTGSGLAFAPEIKGVLCAPGLARQLNMTALAEYVRFQQLLGDKTWFEGVQLLPPASLLRYRSREDQLTLSRYWDWDAIGSQPRISFDEAVEESIRLFQRAINAMIKPPHQMGVYLSGGLDGRTILGFIDQQVPVTTITFGAPDCRDVLYAEQLARRAKSQHHWFPLMNGRWVLDHASLHLALTEGMHSWMHAHGISTLNTARQLIDVNLSGWDGGTILGGRLDEYDRDPFYRHAPSEIDLLQRLYDAFCQNFTWPGLTEAEEASLFSNGGDSRLRGLAFESLRAELAATLHYPPDRRVDYFYLQQVDRRQFQNQIVTARLAIEVRCPFFDYDFVSFIYSLPERIHNNAAFRSAVITRRMPHLATIPCDKDNRLPHSNKFIAQPYATWQRAQNWINRRVAPIFPQRPRLYADYEYYLRTDLREWAQNIIFDQHTQDRGFFDPEAVRALWERHLTGKELWTIGKIAPLITLELALRNMYDHVPHEEAETPWSVV